MSKQPQQRERRERARAAGMFCGLTLTLTAAVTGRFAWPRHDSTAQTVAAPLTPIAYRTRLNAETARPTPVVTITVDAQNAPAADHASDLASLREALDGGAPLPGSLPDDSASPASDSLPNWFAWARLNKPRAAVRTALPASLPTNSLGVYAARGEWGVTLCLVNKTDARLLTHAQLRLPRGVYTIERLTFGGKRKENSGGKGTMEDGRRETEAVAAPERLNARTPEHPTPNAQHPTPYPLMERLEGCDLGGVTTARKGYCLEPGEVCFYRCIDTAREARVGWFDVFTQLKGMESKHPGPARRLATMLHEADSYVRGVHGGGSRGDGEQSRLGCIHHLLLVTAQAHSLHHNYQMRHTVEEGSGKAVMASLDRLTDSLSQTSAVLLGLVPQVTVHREQETGNRGQASGEDGAQQDAGAAKKEKLAVVSNKGAGEERLVTVALANTGGRSISNVKLGLNMAAMPSGLTCEPGDPAYFDALHPGQTGRATFRVRSKSAVDWPALTFTGDVSYFTGTAPAHLRPRAW